VTQLIFPTSGNNIDIPSLLIFLGQQQLNNIWIEAGSTLSGFLLKTGLIDEVILYMSPKILGHKAKSLCVLHEILEL
ncbi:dihydrofolate reductase family protein, partial [Buchnera aphidicola]|nr:dihydrofolate reductase family protein [Buchnera aphidicola]